MKFGEKHASEFWRKSDVSRYADPIEKEVTIHQTKKNNFIRHSLSPRSSQQKVGDASCSIGDAEYRNQSHVWRASRGQKPVKTTRYYGSITTAQYQQPSEILHRMQSEKRHNRKCCPPAFYHTFLAQRRRVSINKRCGTLSVAFFILSSPVEPNPANDRSIHMARDLAIGCTYTHHERRDACCIRPREFWF